MMHLSFVFLLFPSAKNRNLAGRHQKNPKIFRPGIPRNRPFPCCTVRPEKRKEDDKNKHLFVNKTSGYMMEEVQQAKDVSLEEKWQIGKFRAAEEEFLFAQEENQNEKQKVYL